MESLITSLLGQLRRAGSQLGRSSVVILAAAVLAMPGKAAFAADRFVTITTETIEIVDYYDEGGEAEGYFSDTSSPRSPALAAYGPFRVVAPDRFELVGDVDSYTPGEFRAMLADYPGLRSLAIVECGGTVDDNANLALARMIRAAGIATHVPAQGSVRSGGVELFLAGVNRTADPGAEFIVHSWRDNYGREARDYAASDPVHAPYLSFYREVGMAPERARAFYALTNSVPNGGTRQLTLGELASFELLN